MLKRIRDAYAAAMAFEPARLTNLKAQAIILLGALGVSLSPAADAKVSTIVGVAVSVLTFLHTEAVRKLVYAPATVHQEISHVVEVMSTTPQDDFKDDVDPAATFEEPTEEEEPAA